MLRETFFTRIARLLFCSCLALVACILVLADDVTSTLLIGRSKIDVSIEAGEMKLTHPELLDWVQTAAKAVATYYGRYPVSHVRVRIIPVDGSGVRHGQTFGYDGGLIKIRVGEQMQAADLSDDWMLTHEMVHLSFPSMADEHHWIEEGIAVYVEPIARIQAGQFSAARMWFELVRDMPKGLPESGDAGLDHTHTWGRTYWGGALFCFLADVEIRKQTQNKKGLQDALRAILNAGGDMRYDWPIEKALQTGDRAVGGEVLLRLYEQMRDRPMQVDLDSLWKQLGVRIENGTAQFNGNAPLAKIREAITVPKPRS